MRIARHVVATACSVEGVTGLSLLMSPSLVTRLLLGGEAPGTTQIVGRVAGIALISLSIACWPRGHSNGDSEQVALLTYNALAVFVLAETGIVSDRIGLMLWPAVFVHVALAIFLAVALAGERARQGPRQPTSG